MDETEESLLDDSPAHLSVALKLNDEESDLILEFVEIKFIISDFIFWHIFEHIFFNFLNTWNHAMKIYWRVEWLEILLVVSLCVELKHFDH